MSPEELRLYGHQVVDWIADYLEQPSRVSVLPKVKPGEIAGALPRCGPETGQPMDGILDDFKRLIVPGITHWNNPGFMAFFANSASGPGILGEMLTAALNANGMIWKSSPAVTELEQVTLGWLRQWIGMPPEFFGVIYDTASTSSMHAIAAARELADPEARSRGTSPGLILYTSEQSHSSIEKGAIAVGIGQRNVRKIGVDSEFRMRMDLLEEAIKRDLSAGLRPFCVTATIGTTSTTSVDPVNAIADIAERYKLWFHVDSAYAGSTAILPEFRHHFRGIERADSLVMNAHKWMLTPMDLSVFFTRRPDILRRAFSLIPEYLRTSEDSTTINLMDYGVPLGRRFRSLKLWFVMRYYGREGIAEILRRQIGWARELAATIDADQRFERIAPVPFSVVCFRYRGTDEENRALLDKVNASGEVFLSHTALNGKFVIRLAIGNMETRREHVFRAWELITSNLPK